jgi:nicotinamide mononucleotide adenylyltransferase
MSIPTLWTESDLEHILGHFGVFVVERAGTDLNDALSNLRKCEGNIHRIPQVVPNEISSTRIRNLLHQRMSVDYLIPKRVIGYIEENKLYVEEEKEEEGKERSRRGSEMDGGK